METAPAHESPAPPMPETAPQKSDGCIAIFIPGPVATLWEGEIEIIAQPTRKRNMPSSPEIDGGASEIGHVEILGQVYADDFRNSDGHVRVAGEIAIDLQRISNHSAPDSEWRIC